MNWNSVKINIVSSGRFHVCDLARELNKNEFNIKFYSFVPNKRTRKFGLPSQCCASVFIFMLPFLFLEKKIFRRNKWASRLRINIQDYITGWYMRKCDILIAMSGDFVYTVKKAKNHGAIIILERGSKHILEQRRILESIPSLHGKQPVPDINVKRELAGYELADYITIATTHVKNSFLLHNYPKDKLFVNPYGVDLSMFKPLSNIKKKYDFIMVGGWSYRKGCDLIIEAIKKTKYTFLHVGAIVDIEMPKDKQFTHIDPIDQSKLITYYNQSKVFIFPSREDGFGMVLSQAIACNLPIIGSKDSGAEDLKNIVAHSQYITILRDYTVDSLLIAMEKAMQNYETIKDDNYAGDAIVNLTWEAYGKRYADFLHKILQK